MKVSMKCPLRIFSQSIESAVTVVTRKTAVAVAVEIKTGAHTAVLSAALTPGGPSADGCARTRSREPAPLCYREDIVEDTG